MCPDFCKQNELLRRPPRLGAPPSPPHGDPDGMASRRSAGPAMVGDRSAATNCTAGRHQDRRITATVVRIGLLRDPVPTQDRRCGVRQSIR
jgi:hypothetical protein